MVQSGYLKVRTVAVDLYHSRVWVIDRILLIQSSEDVKETKLHSR